MSWVLELKKWLRDRKITKPSGKYVENIEEELEEYFIAKTNMDESGRIDAIADIIVFSVNELMLEGYDVNKVMSEVVKEISSRKQDPQQKARWSLEPDLANKEKWQKDKSVKPYTADFSKCKNISETLNELITKLKQKLEACEN